MPCLKEKRAPSNLAKASQPDRNTYAVSVSQERSSDTGGIYPRLYFVMCDIPDFAMCDIPDFTL